MPPTIQAWLFFGGIVLLVVLIYTIVTVIKQKMIGHRLELLAEDILAFGRSSLTTELQRCDFCRNTSHVHLWRYGNANVTKEALICYLCVSRLQKHFHPSASRTGVHAHDSQYVQRDESPLNGSRGRQTLARR